MKFGHHGANHPVHRPRLRPRDDHEPEPRLRGGRDDAAGERAATHRSLFDGSLQGIACTDRPAFSFQGHPEASPGPRDLAPLFSQFVEMMLRKGAAPRAQARLTSGRTVDPCPSAQTSRAS
jgi:carbamoyl-phosphate synthase small subunit